MGNSIDWTSLKTLLESATCEITDSDDGTRHILNPVTKRTTIIPIQDFLPYEHFTDILKQLQMW